MFRPKQLLIPLFILSVLTISCNNKKPLIKKDESNENEKNNTLFVFVGEKIEVKELPPDTTNYFLVDGKFSARYKILQRVYGNYDNDEIEFTAYDHYGTPDFNNYKNSLLFVSKRNGKYYHEKYQFHSVYKTKDNRWAGAYSVHDFGQDGKRNKSVQPQKIDFAEEVSYPLSLVEKDEIDCWFPEPYYKISGDKAIAFYGNYIEDLFKIKKEGVLTARGLFGNKNPDDLDVIDTQMAEVLGRLSKKDTLIFSLCKSGLQSLEKSQLKENHFFDLDSIAINDTIYKSGNLISSGIIDQDLFLALKDSTKISYSIHKIPDNTKVLFKSKNNLNKKEEIFWQITVNKRKVKTIQTIVKFNFIKTKQGYKLYACNQYENSICWQ